MKKEKRYQVYDEENKLLGVYKTAYEIAEAYSFKSTMYIYSSVNYGVYVFNNKVEKKKYLIRKVELLVEEPIMKRKRHNGKVSDLPGEEWRKIPEYPEYRCSNKGRFKKVYDEENELLLKTPEHINKNGRKYRGVSFRNDRKRYTASRVIVHVFRDPTFPLTYNTEDNRVCDHIDNNSTNDCLENLQILSYRDNLLKAFTGTEGSVKILKKCFIYDGVKRKFYEFKSTKEASEWLIKRINKIFGYTGDEKRKGNTGYFSRMVSIKSVKASRFTAGYSKEECLETWKISKKDKRIKIVPNLTKERYEKQFERKKK